MTEATAPKEARRRRERLNDLLVDTFDAILRIEEQSLNNRITKGCTIAEIHTIAAVGMYNKDPMGLVAGRLGVTLATLTTAIGRLEKRGLVQRERDQADHRRVLVSLTKEGRKICRAHDMFHRQMVEGALADLTEEEEVVFEGALSKVKHFFDDHVD
ncbi:MAG: winged helix DNA-binding protein [Coriobacteriia bacterium]|nr:winged helix DNA-binding protein [Coriobacteriia bacterium]